MFCHIPCVKFASLTFGASSSGQQKTIKFLDWLLEKNPEKAKKIALHVTCSGNTKREIMEIITKYNSLGIKKFVVIRGDGNLIENEFKYAYQLVFEIKNKFIDSEIFVAGYPENENDLDNVKNKISKGANAVITQMCFDTQKIIEFKNKIHSKILPGLILPNEKVKKFAEKLNIYFPDEILNNPEKFLENQIKKLLDVDFNHFHFYTMNAINCFIKFL